MNKGQLCNVPPLTLVNIFAFDGQNIFKRISEDYLHQEGKSMQLKV